MALAAQTLSMATTTATDDVDARYCWGETKIYLAAEAGDAAEVGRLLELKADFELPTTDFRRHAVAFKQQQKKKTQQSIYDYFFSLLNTA